MSQIRSSIEQSAGYLSVECGHDGPRELGELYREMAVQCILQQADRVLLKATECGSEGHYALRDAFTAMILAGIPPGFRLAMVTDGGKGESAFQNLQGDLRRLGVNAALFSDEAKAVAWLRARKPAAQVHAPAPQQAAKRPHGA